MANYYVRTTAQGVANGTSWNTAWSMSVINWGLLVGGDTVWIAGGTYSSMPAIPSGKSGGGTMISFRRVVASDSISGSSNPQWQTIFDSPILSPTDNIAIPSVCSWLLFDGRTQGGWVFQTGAGGGTTVILGGGAATVSNLSFLWLDSIGLAAGQAQGQNYASNDNAYTFTPSNGSSVSNILISHCRAMGKAEALQFNSTSNVIVEYCYIADTHTDNTGHADWCYCFTLLGPITFRYCYFNNSPVDGLFHEYGTSAAMSYYGNVFYNSKGPVINFKGPSAYGPVFIYNNTFYGTDSVDSDSMSLAAATSTFLGAGGCRNNLLIATGSNFGGGGKANVLTTNNAYSPATINGFGWPSGETNSFLLTGPPYAYLFLQIPADVEGEGVFGTQPTPGQSFRPQPAQYATLRRGVSLTADGFLNMDMDGNVRGNSGTWLVGAFDAAGTDTTPPNQVTGLSATNVSSNSITINWLASSDLVTPQASLVYNVRNGGVDVSPNPTAPGATSLIQTGLAPSTQFSYTVRARDAAGNFGAFSNAFLATTLAADTTPPTAPGTLTATAFSNFQINLSWLTATDPPNASTTVSYTIERAPHLGSFTQIGSVTAGVLNFQNTGLTQNTAYDFRVRSLDSASLPSAAYSNTASATTLNQILPPAFVQAAETDGGLGNVLASQAATFAVAQTAGNTNIVFVAWHPGATTVTGVTDSRGNLYTSTGTATNLGVRSEMSFYANNIVASAVGNVVTATLSPASDGFDVRILEYSGIDDINPFEGRAVGTGATTTATAGPLTTLNAVDMLVAGQYGADGATGPGAGYTQRILGAGAHIVEEQLVNAAGSYTATAPLSGATGWIMQLLAFRATDVTGPTVPVISAVDSVTFPDTQINLSWTAATDTSSPQNQLVYLLEHMGGGIATFTQFAVTSAGATSFTDTGLTASTLYSYRMKARDQALNLSLTYSNTATATTAAGADQPPNQVTGLQVIPS